MCFCDDCQSFAHWLGDAQNILDENGGTDIFQTTPSRVKIEEGEEQLGCMRLSPNGTPRWFAKCCRTQLANIARSPKMPFVGMSWVAMDHEAHGKTRAEALGPITVRINARYAIGTPPAGSQQGASAGFIFKAALGMLKDSLGGRTKPTPFFNDAGELSVTPEVVSMEERKALLVKCGPNPGSPKS